MALCSLMLMPLMIEARSDDAVLIDVPR